MISKILSFLSGSLSSTKSLASRKGVLPFVFGALLAGGAQEGRIYVENSYDALDLLLGESVRAYAQGDESAYFELRSVVEDLERFVDPSVEVNLAEAKTFILGKSQEACYATKDSKSPECFNMLKAEIFFTHMESFHPAYRLNFDESFIAEDLVEKVKAAIDLQETLTIRKK